jgi:hypothetical protein
MAAARREGHRLFEMSGADGALITVVLIFEPRQIQELAQLMDEAGISGSLEPIL